MFFSLFVFVVAIIFPIVIINPNVIAFNFYYHFDCYFNVATTIVDVVK
jgi:hypothetical protein